MMNKLFSSRSCLSLSLAFTCALLSSAWAVGDDCTRCESFPTSITSKIKPADYTQKVKLEPALANTLLEKAMGHIRLDLVRAALRCGADAQILHQSPMRLQVWDYLLLDEELRHTAGMPIEYSEEDWAILLDSKRERYVYAPDARLIIKHLQDKGLDINKASSQGTALELAIKTGQGHAIQAVLDAGAKPAALSPERRKKMNAILNQYANIQSQKGIAIPWQSPDDPTGEKRVAHDLNAALATMDAESLEAAMLRVRALKRDKEIINEAFIWAMRSSNLEKAKYLLSQGADINTISTLMDGPQRTAVSIAASQAHPNAELVQYLMSQGAVFFTEPYEYPSRSDLPKDGINVLNAEGTLSALMLHLSDFLFCGTSNYAPARATELYLSLGADPNLENRQRRNAIFYALGDSRIHNLAALLLAGGNVNDTDCDGRTPLYLAVEHGSILSTFMMLEAGANPCVLDDYGKGINDCHPSTQYYVRYYAEKYTPIAIDLVKSYQDAKNAH